MAGGDSGAQTRLDPRNAWRGVIEPMPADVRGTRCRGRSRKTYPKCVIRAVHVRRRLDTDQDRSPSTMLLCEHSSRKAFFAMSCV